MFSSQYHSREYRRERERDDHRGGPQRKSPSYSPAARTSFLHAWSARSAEDDVMIRPANKSSAPLLVARRIPLLLFRTAHCPAPGADRRFLRDQRPVLDFADGDGQPPSVIILARAPLAASRERIRVGPMSEPSRLHGRGTWPVEKEARPQPDPFDQSPARINRRVSNSMRSLKGGLRACGEDINSAGDLPPGLTASTT